MMTANSNSPSLLSSATASSSSTSTSTAPSSVRLPLGTDETLNSSPFPPSSNPVQSFGLSPASVKSEPVAKSASKRNSKQQMMQAQQQQLLYMDTSSNHSLSPSNCSSPSSTHNPNDSNNNNLSSSNESYSHPHLPNSQYSSSTSTSRFLSSADSLRIDYPLPSSNKRSRSNSSRSDTSSKQLTYTVPVTKSESQSQIMEQDFSNNAECHSAAINLCVTPHSSRDSPACSSSAGSVSHLDNYTGPPHDGEYQMYSDYEPLDFSRPLNLCKNESYRFIPEEGVWRPW